MTTPSGPLGGHVITIRRAPLVMDARYRAQVRDWPMATSTLVRGVYVQPYTAIESDVDREWASTHVRLFAPHSIDLRSTDRVEWGGATWDVDGEPMRWDDDAGRPDYVEAALKRHTG